MVQTTRASERIEELFRAACTIELEPARARERRFASAPALAALRRAGTLHVYADTAAEREIDELAPAAAGGVPEEIDGNTANQPLVRKALDGVLEAAPLERWHDVLADACPGATFRELVPWIHALVCARMARGVVEAFSDGRGWDTSIQLHMDLVHDPRAAVRVGELLARLVPGAVVKVPFAPDAPHTLLAARELERRGIPTNVTSTFSARQAVVAALLANPKLTNVFLGRLGEGLRAELLGEHVVLEAQRVLCDLRRRGLTRTLLIAASIRDWRTFPRLAGCDAFTAPCAAIRDFLTQRELPPERVVDQRSSSHASSVRIADDVLRVVGAQKIAALSAVPAEWTEFLVRHRGSREWLRLDVDDGEAVRAQLAEGGCGELFHFPTGSEREELARSKLPLLDEKLIGRIPLDTHYSLMANADFARHQAEIDARIEERVHAGSGRA